MTEQWRPVVGYEGLYAVSDLGRVRSLTRRVRSGKPDGRTVNERLLAPQRVAGYPAVTLRKDARRRSEYVHRMVLLAFVGPCPPRCECLHDDGDRSNCALSNLRWGTSKENAADRVRHGTAIYWNNPASPGHSARP